MNTSRILESLHVGGCPLTPADVAALAGDGFTGVVNLQTAEDFSYWSITWPELRTAYREQDVRVAHVPTRDFQPDILTRNLPAIVRSIRDQLREERKVYVHCNIGVNRSPTAVIAYLTWVGGWDLEAAASHVAACRPEVAPYLDAIRQATRVWRTAS